MSEITVIICSTKRPRILHETVTSILRQTILPREIILAVTESADILPETMQLPRVGVITARKGASCQRNDAIAVLDRASMIVSFFDDDVELRCDYLETIVRVLQLRPDIALVTGHLLPNGAGDGEIPRMNAIEIVDHDLEQFQFNNVDLNIKDQPSANGCNMSTRELVLADIRFDERLPLYSWLEDADFSTQCRRFGRVVSCDQARLVHMSVSSGRIAGRQFGFSQFMNSYYLWRKGGLVTPFPRLIYHFWLRAFAANLLGAIRNEKLIDRRGRLLGNLEALWFIVRGKIEPEYILRMKEHR